MMVRNFILHIKYPQPPGWSSGPPVIIVDDFHRLGSCNDLGLESYKMNDVIKKIYYYTKKNFFVSIKNYFRTQICLNLSIGKKNEFSANFFFTPQGAST